MSQAHTPTQNRHDYEDESEDYDSEDDDSDDDDETQNSNPGFQDDLTTGTIPLGMYKNYCNPKWQPRHGWREFYQNW